MAEEGGMMGGEGGREYLIREPYHDVERERGGE
jgi:hypothetical protein